MEVLSLDLIDFRNYEQAHVELSGGLNVIIGRNGQGKTNLLEAISVISTLGSHRTSSNASMVRHGADACIIRARIDSEGHQVSIDVEIKRSGGIRFLVNKVGVDRGNVQDVLVGVIFSPEDLSLIKGGPEERRRFIDHASARTRPLAAAERHEFERVLKQRNGVLKASQTNPRALHTLDVWDEHFVKAGASLVRERLQTLSQIGARAAQRYIAIAGEGEPPSFGYEASWQNMQGSLAPTDIDESAIADGIGDALRSALTRDLERGLTTVGPHRDDISIELDGQDARVFASQGEQRSLALSMRLAERDVIIDIRNKRPVLLLDDVFSELDDPRRAQLSELVASSGQTIATATSAEGLPVVASRTVRVESGKVLDE
ncbi:MAG: DNA replication/repair protein RecF [Actinomycetota bacterium]